VTTTPADPAIHAPRRSRRDAPCCDHAGAAWLLAKALPLLNRHDEAFAAWKRAFEQFSDQRAIMHDYSGELLDADRPLDARDVCRASVARLPAEASLRCNLAVTEILCGDLAAAEQAIGRSMKLDPDDKIAKTIRSELQAYRDGKPLPRRIDDVGP
jgi:tetratricopeptide (TPR) repeat protein